MIASTDRYGSSRER